MTWKHWHGLWSNLLMFWSILGWLLVINSWDGKSCWLPEFLKTVSISVKIKAANKRFYKKNRLKRAGRIKLLETWWVHILLHSPAAHFLIMITQITCYYGIEITIETKSPILLFETIRWEYLTNSSIQADHLQFEEDDSSLWTHIDLYSFFSCLINQQISKCINLLRCIEQKEKNVMCLIIFAAQLSEFPPPNVTENYVYADGD